MEGPKPKFDYVINRSSSYFSHMFDITLETTNKVIVDKILMELEKYGQAFYEKRTRRFNVFVRDTYSVKEVEDYMDNYIFHLLYMR
jgi:hypothetical protein